LLSYSESQTLNTSLPGTLVPVTENFIDLLWGSDRPERPSTEIFQLDNKFTGESVSSKLLRMREILAKSGSRGMVVSQLDEVAWLFNLRANDIPFNPVKRFFSNTSSSCTHTQVFFAYAILTPDECTLFANPLSLTEAIRGYLHDNNIAVVDYDQMWTSLRTLNGIIAARRANYPMPPGEAGQQVTVQGIKLEKTDKVLIGSKTSWAVAQAIGEVGDVV
jgi:Xaa-Pro aminopeptidase